MPSSLRPAQWRRIGIDLCVGYHSLHLLAAAAGRAASSLLPHPSRKCSMRSFSDCNLIDLTQEPTCCCCSDMGSTGWVSSSSAVSHFLAKNDPPQITSCLEALQYARTHLESNHFDFISHVCTTIEGRPRLVARRFYMCRCWLDLNKMRCDMPSRMDTGVKNSSVFVALVSRASATRLNAMLELGAARDHHKPIICVIVDEPFQGTTASSTWWSSPTSGTSEEMERTAAFAFFHGEFASCCSRYP